jgi:hypothetical protein
MVAINLSTMDSKSKRDLYATILRESNPDLDAFTKDEILKGFTPDVDRLFEKGNGLAAGAKAHTRHCVTQKGSSIDELFLGMGIGSLYLWKTGSKINWIARKDGYKSPEDALFSARECYTAAEAWNRALAGRVEFVYVDRFDDACFQLKYNPGGVSYRDGFRYITFASAFFPQQYDKLLNTVTIFQPQLDPDWRAQTAYTFSHELGHVLGLRHEHSQEDVQRGAEEDVTEGIQSMLFGSRNINSVMAYYDFPKIQETDIKDLCDAYDQLQHGTTVKGLGVVPGPGDRELPGRNVEVAKKVYRVAPDN